MPKVTEAHVEARRRQILEAALTCFAEKGFHGATMHDICTASGLSPGAVYRYFPGKEDIVAAMTEEGIQLSAQYFASADGIEYLHEVAAEQLRSGQARRFARLHIELLAEAGHNPRIAGSMHKRMTAIAAHLAGLIRSQQACGQIDETLDPESVARVLLASYQGLIHQLAIDPDLDVDAFLSTSRAIFGGKLGQKTGKQPSERSTS